MRKIAPALFLLLFVGWSFAQKPATAGSPTHKTPAKQVSAEAPTEQQVLKLLELLQVEDGVKATIDAMKEQVKMGAEQNFRDRIPNATPEQLKHVNTIVDESFTELKLDDLMKNLVPIYQKHLTRADVQAVITFYTSPVGQKLRREQPAMMRETMEANAATQRVKLEAVLAKMDIRIEQYANEQGGK
ncbi:MAG TPA: DUF2059 domain-containing protein [Candidatus Angelobacter sp.]|jgi:hypothetical protein|nr:DUF2059 domain-containing protein [Candidatus Angelobacter sp.]